MADMDYGYDPDLESPDEYQDYELEEDFDKVFQKAGEDNDREALLGVGIVTIATGYIVGNKLSRQDKKILKKSATKKPPGRYIRDTQLMKMLRLPRPTTKLTIPHIVIPKQDLIRLKQIYNETRAYNLVSNPKNIENLAYRNGQLISERTGMYGMIEADKQGELVVYQNTPVKILIPWETAGDDKVCLDCEDLADNGPYHPEDYPEPPHFGCRCMPGEPIITT